ncbi:hypothetical protein D3C80_1747710 [compost metagenome]
MDFQAAANWLWWAVNAASTSPLVTALVGAVVGGLFTMWATKQSLKRTEFAATKSREMAEQKAGVERQIIVYNTSQLILVEV